MNSRHPTDHWEVELHGNHWDLDDVRECLPPSIAVVTVLDGRYFLSARAFEEFDDARGVYSAAQVLMHDLNAGLDLLLSGYQPTPSCKKLVVRVEKGKRNQFVLVDSAVVTCRAGRVKVLLDGVEQVNPYVLESTAAIMLTMQNHRVRELLRNLPKSPDAFELYKALEIIRSDCTPSTWRSISTALNCSYDEVQRCLDGLNRHDVLGHDARHSSANLDPRTTDPMDLAQATEFVKELARSWVKAKLSAESPQKAEAPPNPVSGNSVRSTTQQLPKK